MGHHFNGRPAQQQRRFAKRAQKVDANHFFNLLTDPRMLGMVEALLPEHRERQFPPTVTLAMFLGQIMSADGSCQNAVNEAIVARLLAGMNPGSVNTSGYCQARQRLPQEMVGTLARQSGTLLGEQTPHEWLWQGRHVKLVDGTTVSMPDTAENQARFPQHGQQEPGVGFPLARLVGVIALSNGAVLDAAIGPYQGKGTGEHGLFRGLKRCFKEFWTYLLAYNLIRLLMAQAALQADVLPRQLSFKHTLQIWVAWSQRQFLSGSGEDTATLFVLIAQLRVADRPGRVEPRAVKRRPKPYPRLDKPRRKARMEIERRGHATKLRA
jgi:hypothetical protein